MIRLLHDVLDRTVILSFDKTGFERHSKRFEPDALDVDMRGRVCLVTGASSGLGVAVARGLAARGATVHMLCRDVSKGETVREALLRDDPDADLRVERVDLSDHRSIRAFVDDFAPPSVDVLIHNAGVLPGERETTIDGLELTVATNLVGPLLLTHLIWPKLSARARLIHVSSGGMYSEKLDVEALFEPADPFDGVKAYAQTKRAQVVLTELLAQRSGIRVSSMHPGWADTPGVRTSLPRFYALARRLLRSPEQGADTILWLAMANNADAPAGQFFFDRAPERTHLSSRTREPQAERDALWSALCERICADPEAAFR